MNMTVGCPIPGASQPKEPVRLINANALKKRAVKVMFRDTPESGEFYAVGTDDIDIMPLNFYQNTARTVAQGW